ncbi:MAG: VanZ like family protein [Firmicutes bacterium ADurb.Bin193]|nr:MAG: VanZ like family protein [Firmicutes bacterium ADurb.Bin193]
MKYIRIVLWTVTITIMTVIFLFSDQPAPQSDEISRGITVRITEAIPYVQELPEDEKETVVKNVNNTIRKAAHFMLYFLLGIVLILSIKYTFLNITAYKLWIISLIVCIVYAISDEIHQIFVDGRGAQIQDIIIDSLGAMLGSALPLFLRTYIKKHGSS